MQTTNQFINPVAYSINNIRVVRLIVQETGTYNQMALRPFQTYLDTDVMRRLQEDVREGMGIVPELIAGSAGMLMRPSDTPQGIATIPWGWTHQRLRWVLQVEISTHSGQSAMEFISGYTDLADLSLGGLMDPNTRFYINAINTVRAGMAGGLNGAMMNSSNILTSQQATGINDPNRMLMQRPQDVVEFMSDNLGLPGLSWEANANKILSASPTKSLQRHAAPARYLADIIGSFALARHTENYQGVGEETAATVYSRLKNEPGQRDSFLAAMMRVNGWPMTQSSFTLGDLVRLDPNTPNVTVVRSVAHQRHTVHFEGQSEHWLGSDMMTQIATSIAQGLPSYMFDSCIQHIQFTITSGMPMLITSEPRSFFGSMNLAGRLENFKVMVQNELMMAASLGGLVYYDAQVDCDLFGDTRIKLCIDGLTVPGNFVFPSFCDSLLSPVITNRPENAHRMYREISAVVDELGQVF